MFQNVHTFATSIVVGFASLYCVCLRIAPFRDIDRDMPPEVTFVLTFLLAYFAVDSALIAGAAVKERRFTNSSEAEYLMHHLLTGLPAFASLYLYFNEPFNESAKRLGNLIGDAVICCAVAELSTILLEHIRWHTDTRKRPLSELDPLIGYTFVALFFVTRILLSPVAVASFVTALTAREQRSVVAFAFARTDIGLLLGATCVCGVLFLGLQAIWFARIIQGAASHIGERMKETRSNGLATK